MDHRLTCLVFLLTYAGIALGGIPGLALDRTGIALLGAIAMLAIGALSLAEAVAAVDVPTLLLLYGLMVVSAQLQISGFYGRAADLLGRVATTPRRLLLGVMVISAGLSAVLVNDVVCLVFTPVVIVVARQTRRSPVPFLLGLACASNIGSAATLIGNPQNMLIGQVGRLQFDRFLYWCAPPAACALAAAFGVLAWIYRREFRGDAAPKPAGPIADDGAVHAGVAWAPDAHYSFRGSAKGVFGALLLVGLFFTPVPRELAAMAVAGCILVSRSLDTRRILARVDWHLMTLFIGLFVVVQALDRTGLPARWVGGLASAGWHLDAPLPLTLVTVTLSNLVSNVPATLLLVRFLPAEQTSAWYLLALTSTLAGNLITLGSIANLIVLEQARLHGVAIRFGEHARVGIPVTLVSLAIAVLWHGLMSA